MHHGNATQHIFDADPHLLYLSIHQYPYYPGTAPSEEVGRDAGRGFTVNLPLEVGAVDEDYQLTFSRIVVPVLKQFEPDLLIVSAGFDAHERDPLGGMRVTTAAFAAMTRELRAVAEECCRGRIVAAVEGGYDLHALGTSLDGAIDALAGKAQPAQWPSSGIHSSRGEAAVAATSAAIRPFWRV